MLLKNLQATIMISLPIKLLPVLERDVRNRISPAMSVVQLQVRIKPFSLAENRTVNVCNRVVNHLEPLTKE